MKDMSPASSYGNWSESSYVVRVRGVDPPVFLWGSSGLSRNLTFDKPLLLHIRNDVFGEAVSFGTQAASGQRTDFGSLQPGECVSIPLNDLVGVYATCALETTVACLIKH
jgi:hypothetical protein